MAKTFTRSRKAVMADSLNCFEYLPMKNTPEIGWVSNFWGAVHSARSFLAFRTSTEQVAFG